MGKYAWSILVIIAVLIGQFSGIHSAYINEPFYDITMHIFGGIGIGLLASAIMDSFGVRLRRKRAIIISAAVAAGIVWEGAEILFKMTGRELWSLEYFWDTAKDIMNDFIGGAVVAIFFGAGSSDHIAQRPKELEADEGVRSVREDNHDIHEQ